MAQAPAAIFGRCGTRTASGSSASPVSEEKLAAKREEVRQRLFTGAANMIRPGADLIAWYLDPDRLPVADRWSRKHADTQRRLCQRYAAPVIGAVACQDITVHHMPAARRRRRSRLRPGRPDPARRRCTDSRLPAEQQASIFGSPLHPGVMVTLRYKRWERSSC
jgi:hypothetical protein